MSIFILFLSLFMLIFTVGHFIRFFRPILVIQIIQSTHAKVKPILWRTITIHLEPRKVLDPYGQSGSKYLFLRQKIFIF